MSKDIIDKIEGSKLVTYVAIGAGIFAIGTVVWAIKENMDANKAAANKLLAEAELAKTAVENGIDPNTVKETPTSEFSGCCGGVSNASGKIEEIKRYNPNFSGATGRFIPKQVNRPTPPFMWGNTPQPTYAAVRCTTSGGENGTVGNWGRCIPQGGKDFK